MIGILAAVAMLLAGVAAVPTTIQQMHRIWISISNKSKRIDVVALQNEVMKHNNI